MTIIEEINDDEVMCEWYSTTHLYQVRKFEVKDLIYSPYFNLKVKRL